MIVFNRRESLLTFKTLDETSDAASFGLEALGIRSGDRVGMWMGNGPEWVIAMFALAKIGAIIVPVNARFKAQETADVLRQCGASAAIVDDEHKGEPFLEIVTDLKLPELRRVICNRHTVKALPSGVVDFAWLLSGGRTRTDQELAAIDPREPVLIQYTSGTTGFPKGAMLSHRNYVFTAAHVGERQGLSGGRRRLLSAAPFFHCSGTMHAIAVAVAARTTVFNLPLWDAELALEIMRAERCEVGHAVFLRDLLQLAGEGRITPADVSLRVGYWTGPKEEKDAIRALLGIEGICGIYGMTETSGNSTIGDPAMPYELRRETIGMPLPGVDLKLEPITACDAERGYGEILVRGPNVMLGYYDNAAATRDALDNEGWLHTGDGAEYLPDGMIRFSGRLKEIVRVGGENVSPLEVEGVLSRHPSVAEAAITAMPDRRLGEVCVAFVRFAPERTASADELRTYCAELLAAFKVPRAFYPVDTFPRIREKVRKHQLVELVQEGRLQAL